MGVVLGRVEEEWGECGGGREGVVECELGGGEWGNGVGLGVIGDGGREGRWWGGAEWARIRWAWEERGSGG